MSAAEVISGVVIATAMAWAAFIVLFPGPKPREDAAEPSAEGPSR